MQTVSVNEMTVKHNRFYHKHKNEKFTGVMRDANSISYVVDGRFHREDGPAMIYDDGLVAFFLNDTEYDIDEWAKAVGIYDTEEFVLMKLEYG